MQDSAEPATADHTLDGATDADIGCSCEQRTDVIRYRRLERRLPTYAQRVRELEAHPCRASHHRRSQS